jgi:hypothetical protein
VEINDNFVLDTGKSKSRRRRRRHLLQIAITVAVFPAERFFLNVSLNAVST